MDNILEIIEQVASFNWLETIGIVTTALVALIAFFELIPGEQPEKTLRKVVDFLTRFSRK